MRHKAPPSSTALLPFDSDLVPRRPREVVATPPTATLVATADGGYLGLVQQLVACLLSARTRDDVRGMVVRQLFATALTPEALPL